MKNNTLHILAAVIMAIAVGYLIEPLIYNINNDHLTGMQVSKIFWKNYIYSTIGIAIGMYVKSKIKNEKED